MLLKKKSSVIASVILLLFTLAGCGFHLRGQVPLPPQLQQIYIATNSPYDPLIRELKNTLQDLNVTVLAAPKRGAATLHIIQQHASNSFGNVSASTNTRQYTLYYAVVFELLAANQLAIIKPNTLNTYRTLIVNSNQILGSGSEEQTIIKEMRQTVIQMLIARLEAGNTLRQLQQATP